MSDAEPSSPADRSSATGDVAAATLPSAPGGPPSLPGLATLPATALWSDSDGARPGPGGAFSGLVAPPSEIVPPTIGHIGRYALKYELGAGGLGTVYAAHDPLLSRLIAVKTLNVQVRDDERETFNAIFINEARAAGGLSHPHIVTVFDAGIGDENRAYIAMELLKGRDLRQLMQEGWRATPAQAALIVRRVADALAYAHSKGVIHRDVKPANIFMVGRTQPRVLDFGIARVTHRHETDTNQGAGSPYYMAPEQVRRQQTDRRADVFSLGVVLYELLTATKPFRGDTLEKIAHAVVQHEPPPANKVDRNVPRELAEIVAKAMEKDPDRRYRSARSFARELRQWLDANLLADAEGDAPAASASSPAVPKPRPRVAMLAAAAVGGIAVVASIAAAVTWQVLQQPPATTPATAMAPRGAPTSVAANAAPALPAAPTVAVAPPQAPGATLPAPATPGSDPVSSSTNAVAVMAEPAATIDRPPPPPTVESMKVNEPSPAAAAKPAIVAKEVAAIKEPAKETPRERRDREREARALQARAAATAATPAAAVATGKVRIAISPWGLVEVDGTPSGAAPPLTELTLTEGRHQIVVRNGDFPPFVTSVDVVAGQVTAVRYKFGS